MAASFASDSEDEDFLGFTAEDLPCYTREADSDSDISVSDLESEDDDIPLAHFRSAGGDSGASQSQHTVDMTGALTDQTTGTERWSSQLKNIVVEDFTEASGPVNILDKEKNEVDFLNLIFSEEIYQLLVVQTNLYAELCTATKPDDKWRPVTMEEMKAFIGIHVVMSVIQLPTYKQYWTTDSLFKIPSVPAIMTRDRFEKILKYFHCNDSRTNPPRGDVNHDKIHHIRPVFDSVQARLVQNYRPHKDVAIDEAMIPFRGRISYRQYLPAKPCKFGVKVWELADSSNGYVYQMQIYTGKKDTGREVGLASRVVWDLTRILSNKKHHVYMDNYFSSPQLFQDLLDDGLYACGTCRLNRRGWPDQLHKNCLKKVKGTSRQLQKGNLVATSWFDNRQVNLLSTNSDPTVTVNIKRKKKDGTHAEVKAPQVVENYNKNMNGVDHGDQLRMQYPTSRRSKKFWKYLFWFLFDTAITCAYILMRESPNHVIKSRTGKVRQRSQLEFRQNLATQLIGRYRQKRRYEVLTTDSAGRSHWPIKMPKSKRCKRCQSKGVRKDSIYGCKICDVNLCVECFEPFHTVVNLEE